MSKLVKCKACGKDVSKGSKCPSCGKDSRNFFAKHKIIAGIGVVVVLVAIATSGGGKDDNSQTVSGDKNKNETTQVAEQKEEAIQVNSTTLAKDYEANEIKANKKYEDKLLEVTGKVESIDEMMGQTFIILEGDEVITSVQCFFDEDSEIDKVAELNKGDSVTIVGKCDGKSINVGIQNCILK